MQVIWNEQNSEKLYAINEAALEKMIDRKKWTVVLMLRVFEFAMIVVNLLVGVWLILDTYFDQDGRWSIYFLAAMYIGFGLFGTWLRYRRQRDEVQFDPTLIGEIDKSIWRIDYLMQQGRFTFFWYMLPLSIVFSITMILDQNYWFALLFPLVLLPATWFGIHWEARKWHVPKKADLEDLRRVILAEPDS